MRTVLRNTDEAAHVWASQSQDHGKAGNVFFEGPVIYSYGRHFPIAKVYRTETGEHIALFNPAKRSVSTSSHQRAARDAWQGNGEALRAHVDLWPGSRFDDVQTITQAQLDEIKAKQAELDAASQEAEKEAKRKQAKEAKAQAELMKISFPDRLAQWQAGQLDTHRMPEFSTYGHSVQLRYIDGGRRIETSRRAVVPTRAALALWTRYTAGETLADEPCGPYTIDETNAETVKIGCHVIQVQTLREFFSRPAPTTEPEA